MCYFASLNGSVKLLNKKKEFELCTKWTSVRKQVQLAMYVKRQLKPRPSDADFDNHGSRNQEELDIDYLTTMTEEDKTKEIMDMEPLAMQWCEVISQNPPHLDVQFRPLTAMATTTFMMQLPQASSFNLSLFCFIFSFWFSVLGLFFGVFRCLVFGFQVFRFLVQLC